MRMVYLAELKKPYQTVELSGGSDRARIITYDFSDLRLYEQQEISDPMLLASHRLRQGRSSVPRTQIPERRWEEAAQRHARGESLRQLAKRFGVSHEAVRHVLIRYLSNET